MGILLSVALASYANYKERVRVFDARTTLQTLSLKIKLYEQDNGAYPASLAALGDDPLDPWGRKYAYMDLSGPGNGGARKDRNLNPLNSDFDLYSLGKDGLTKTQITNKVSLDDVIRANDGAFIDLAAKF